MNKSIHISLLLLFFVALFSCKKLVEETKKNAFLSAMTEGEWTVDAYMEGTISITEQFSGFRFQFNNDGTVTGRLDNKSYSGSWIGDIPNYAINSNFPDAGDPLQKLNGTWKITAAQTDYVNAEMTTIEGKKILRLKKT